MKFHPLAELFPILKDQEFEDLVADIQTNGLLSPITKDGDEILDGRNRYLACEEAGVAPTYKDYDGDDPLAFVISKNLHRRHLSESQRALVAAEISNLDVGRPSINTPIGGVSQDDAAQKLNVSTRSVSRGKAVLNKGAPEVIEAIRQGDLSLGAAAGIVQLPVPDQVRRLQSFSGADNWYTPSDCVELVRATMGSIDLDPASCDFAQKVVQAKQYYTVEDDGLAQFWFGNVFLNPPYDRSTMRGFSTKLCDEWMAGSLDQAILLGPAFPDSAWFHRCAELSAAFCLTLGRLHFYNEDGTSTNPTQGSVFFYFGPNIDEFEKHFASLGIICELRQNPDQ